MTELPSPVAGPSVVLPTPVIPPRRWRRPAVVGAGAVAALAVAVGGAALLGADDDGPRYSLLAAPAAVDELDGLHYEMVVTGLPFLGDVTMTATQDLDQERIELLMGFDEAAGAVTMIGDLAAGHVYLGGEAMAELLPDDAEWVRIDLDLMDELGGLQGLGDQLALDPLAALDTADLASAVDQGFDEVDGIRAKRYALTVDPLALLESSGAIGDLDDELLGGLADEVEVLLWVDEDNLVRQVRHELEVLGVTMTTTVRIDPTDAAVELPEPDEVVDGDEIVDLLR